jgi:hypothetical protein
MREMVLVAILTVSGAVAAPQDVKAARADMAQQLQSRFVLSKFAGSDLKQAGSVLLVQKEGISATPGSGVGFTVRSFGSNYKDGRIRRDLVSSMALSKVEGLRNLGIGEGVYLLRVQVSEANVVLDVQSCGACNQATPEPYPVRATVTFPFRKGFLETTSADQILGVIGEVFSRNDANQVTQAAPTAATQDVAAPEQQAAAPPVAAPPVEAPAEPGKIELGQSLEQVQNILGRPEKMVDLGSKKIYVYKDLKITFVDGRVTDVQ